MIDCLFMAPGGHGLADSRLYWQPAQGAGRWLDLPALGAELAGVPLALVLPGERLSACSVALPTSKARWLRQALQYAVEEQLAEDVEQLHLAMGEPQADGRVRVLAVRRDWLKALLAEAQAAGLQVDALHADFDLLPAEGCHALIQGERGLLGGAGDSRLVFPASDWPQLQAQLGDVQLHQPHDPFAWQAQQRGHAIDLAQGEFAVQRSSGRWQAWQPVAGLLGLWLVLQLAFDIGQAWYFQHQGDAFAAQSRALYQELFPQDTRIVNLKAQFADHLSQAGSGQSQGLLGQLQQIRSAIGEAALTVDQLDYSQERGDLSLQVRAGNFGELEQLRQRLSEAGLPAQLGSANRDEQGVSARVVIGGGA